MINNIGALGGLRIEARVKADCLGDAVRKFMRRKPWNYCAISEDKDPYFTDSEYEQLCKLKDTTVGAWAPTYG